MSEIPKTTHVNTVDVPRISKVSVICWDASFRERFNALHCLQDQTWPKDRYEILFVEFYRDVNPEVKALAEQCPNMRVVTLGNAHPGEENRHLIGACINEGLRQATGDLIVVPEADVEFGEGSLEETVRRHDRFEELALYYYRMDEMPTDTPVRPVLHELRKACELPNPSNYGGCLSVRRRWLEEINGFEEHELFTGYSCVDVDTAARLRAIGLAIQWHPSEFVYHGHHPGSRAPDSGSSERLRRQYEWVLARMKARESLPCRGLDPDVRSDWRPQQPADGPTPPSRTTRCLRRLSNALLPRAVRVRLIAALQDRPGRAADTEYGPRLMEQRARREDP